LHEAFGAFTSNKMHVQNPVRKTARMTPFSSVTDHWSYGKGEDLATVSTRMINPRKTPQMINSKRRSVPFSLCFFLTSANESEAINGSANAGRTTNFIGYRAIPTRGIKRFRAG